uniref:hypothetical protein n=1 Tax=Candidatus Cardinium sp. cByotN1 TaxID=2699439 RepID=UPI001FB46189
EDETETDYNGSHNQEQSNNNYDFNKNCLFENEENDSNDLGTKLFNRCDSDTSSDDQVHQCNEQEQEQEQEQEVTNKSLLNKCNAYKKEIYNITYLSNDE